MSEVSSSGESMKFWDGFCIATMFWLFVLVTVTSSMTKCHNADVTAAQAKAIKLGAAEWIVNPDNGTTTFKWKEPHE